MNPWKRRYFHYYFEHTWSTPTRSASLSLELDFITYHLIKWIHGEKELIRMTQCKVEFWEKDQGK